jgi:hypothetical protein
MGKIQRPTFLLVVFDGFTLNEQPKTSRSANQGKDRNDENELTN